MHRGPSPRSVGVPREYSRSRMFGAPAVFAAANISTHLRHQSPVVLALENANAPSLLDLDLGVFGGPPSLGLPARPREMGIFNPSLATAPAGLCERCAYVAAVRVDPLHQCHERSPLLHKDPGMPKNIAANAFFKGTAIAVLDADLKVLGWTWLLNAPQHQVSSSTSRWFAPVGAADRFPPPWAKAVYDVRVVGIDGRLFVSYVCRKCAFSIAQLQLTATRTPSGGLTTLRAWQSRRYSSTAKWAQGRNQALFAAPRTLGGKDELMVQPWMGIVASFGHPSFSTAPTLCKKGNVRLCGATPPGTRLTLERVANERKMVAETQGFGWLDMVGNSSHAELSKAAIGGHRLSTTSNLVRVVRGKCTVYLGVGHVHRSEGELNKRMAMVDDEENDAASGLNATELQARARARRRRRRQKKQGLSLGANNSSDGVSTAAEAPAFMWGFQYTHFLYALEPQAPFRVIATSREFCLASQQEVSDCESIQFVSGITHAAGSPETLLLSYGVNDCEAKVGRLSLERAWAMLTPLGGQEKVGGCW